MTKNFFAFLAFSLIVASSAVYAQVRPSSERSGIVVRGNETPIDGTRLLDYPARDREGKAITANLVAQAITNDYAACSRYGAVQERRGDLNSTTQGVELKLLNFNQVKVAYLNGKGTSNGAALFGSRSPMTKSGQDLTFTVDEKSPGQFEWSASPVVENKAFDLVIPIPLLDDTANIIEDVKRCMKDLQPRVRGGIEVTDEIDAPYPAAAVFANYVRFMGKPVESGVETDARWGKFKVVKNRVSTTVRVKTFPYRNGSKTQISYQRGYAILPGGVKNDEPDEAQQLVAQLKKIALE
jgi:hypothetical protein